MLQLKIRYKSNRDANLPKANTNIIYVVTCYLLDEVLDKNNITSLMITEETKLTTMVHLLTIVREAVQFSIEVLFERARRGVKQL